MFYQITYLHRGETNENPLYTPGHSVYRLESGTLQLTLGRAGSLTLTLAPDSPAAENIRTLTDEIIVRRNGTELWRGRAVTVTEDLYGNRVFTCEGLLAMLADTWYPPYDFHGAPSDFLASVLDAHNAGAEAAKQILPGNITVTDSNNYIYRSDIRYQRCLDVLTDKLSGSSLGGYLALRVAGGKKYLDYLVSPGTAASQTVTLGENLLDITRTAEESGRITALLPLGAKDETTGEYLTIESVNNGSRYITDEAAVKEYGFVADCVQWEDVTLAKNLLTKAKAYLAAVDQNPGTITARAIDLAMVKGSGETAIGIGDLVRIVCEPRSIDTTLRLTSMDIDFLNPENDILQFGTEDSYTELTRRKTAAIEEDIDTMDLKLRTLGAETITADRIDTEGLFAQDITASGTISGATLKGADVEAKKLTVTNGSVSAQLRIGSFHTIKNQEASLSGSTLITTGTVSQNPVFEVYADDTNAYFGNLLYGAKGSFGTLYTPKLTAGQTFATTACAGTLKLPVDGAYTTVADFITENGSSGTVWWRKYASGRCEIWGYSTISSVVCTTAWGSSYTPAAKTTITLPFGVKHAAASATANGSFRPENVYASGTSLTMWLYRDVAATAGVTIWFRVSGEVST